MSFENSHFKSRILAIRAGKLYPFGCYWNGRRCVVASVTVEILNVPIEEIPENSAPWWAPLRGQIRPALVVQTETGETFILDDKYGTATVKIALGKGSFEYEHSEIPQEVGKIVDWKPERELVAEVDRLGLAKERLVYMEFWRERRPDVISRLEGLLALANAGNTGGILGLRKSGKNG